MEVFVHSNKENVGSNNNLSEKLSVTTDDGNVEYAECESVQGAPLIERCTFKVSYDI